MKELPSNFLVVEDSAAGIEAAQKAGMKVVQFSNGKASLCGIVFSHYSELNQIISVA